MGRSITELVFICSEKKKNKPRVANHHKHEKGEERKLVRTSYYTARGRGQEYHASGEQKSDASHTERYRLHVLLYASEGDFREKMQAVSR